MPARADRPAGAASRDDAARPSANAPGESLKATRRAMVAACRDLVAQGLTQGTSGNIGVRWRDGLLVTPSGVPYDAMAPKDMVFVGPDGRTKGRLAPSSEWRIHADVLAARPELGAVVHAHPTYATALAMHGRAIPAAHYMIAAAGGPTIRCAPYATYGTQDLSDHAVEALAGRTACLLANHGLLAAGPTLQRALWLAVEVETLARQYVVALQLGEPAILPDDEIARVVEKFKSYGPRAT